MDNMPKIPTGPFTFSEVLVYLKSGCHIGRTGWNGKNMYIYLDRNLPGYEPVIVMKTAQGTYQPGWLASQADLLAEDWVVL